MKSKTILVIFSLLFINVFAFDNTNTNNNIVINSDYPVYSTISSFENHIEDLYSDCKLDTVLSNKWEQA